MKRNEDGMRVKEWEGGAGIRDLTKVPQQVCPFERK